jgi:tetratricopeptide (TPR) repeat protein
MLDWLEIPDKRNKNGAGALKEDVHRLRPAEELMLSAQRLYHEGEFRLAAREFGRARRHDPSLFEAWAQEVDARLRAGEVPRAAACANEAIGSYGQVPIFYAAKALVLAHQGYTEAAYQHSDISVKLHDASMFTWLSRGEVVLSTNAYGMMGSVEACFEKALARDPSRWRATFRTALIFAHWGHTERALERLSQVADVRPANPFVWQLMGDCHRQLGHNAEARRCYQTALSTRRNYRPALEALQSMTLWGRLRARLARLLGKKRRRPRATHRP